MRPVLSSSLLTLLVLVLAPSRASASPLDADGGVVDGASDNRDALGEPLDGARPPLPAAAVEAKPTPAAAPPPAVPAAPGTEPSKHHHKKQEAAGEEQPAPPGREGNDEGVADEDAVPNEVAAKVTGTGDPFGDDRGGSKVGGMTFRILLQTRWTHEFDDAGASATGTQNGFQLNRAFLRGTVRPAKWLKAKLLVDFAELAYSNSAQALKLAYGEIRLSKRLEITAGLFKRTFSLLELLAIADFEFAEVGPTDNVIKAAQFGGRDVGAMLRVDPLPKRRWLHVYLGAFGGAGSGAEGLLASNGTAHTGPDLASPNGLLTVRLVSRPIGHLTLGADGAWRPYSTGTTKLPPQSQTDAGKAVSADATYSTERFEIRGEWLHGDRTDLAYRADARTFMAAWGIVALRIPVGATRLMPAARFEWLNTDLEHPEGNRYFASAALNLDVSDQLRVLLDVTRADLRPGSYPVSSPPGVFDRTSTTVVAQLQLRI